MKVAIVFDSQTGNTEMAVSYTHLDVYKRQMRTRRSFWENPLPRLLRKRRK